jgi:hypothetical protein
MSNWEPLDTPNKAIASEPWDFHWKEWKSGTGEFEEFLHDPKSVLLKDFPSIAEDFVIQTTILNHDRGIVNSLVCSMCLIDPERKAVYLTLFKH